MNDLLIGWTTVETGSDARRLAHELVERKLAVCVQIEGPIRSIYRWEGVVTESQEWRLVVKHVPAVSDELAAYWESTHPYSNSQWVVVAADFVAPDYLKWAQAKD